jgi:hypothetical protein
MGRRMQDLSAAIVELPLLAYFIQLLLLLKHAKQFLIPSF